MLSIAAMWACGPKDGGSAWTGEVPGATASTADTGSEGAGQSGERCGHGEGRCAEGLVCVDVDFVPGVDRDTCGVPCRRDSDCGQPYYLACYGVGPGEGICGTYYYYY